MALGASYRIIETKSETGKFPFNFWDAGEYGQTAY